MAKTLKSPYRKKYTKGEWKRILAARRARLKATKAANKRKK